MYIHYTYACIYVYIIPMYAHNVYMCIHYKYYIQDTLYICIYKMTDLFLYHIKEIQRL